LSLKTDVDKQCQKIKNIKTKKTYKKIRGGVLNYNIEHAKIFFQKNIKIIF